MRREGDAAMGTVSQIADRHATAITTAVPACVGRGAMGSLRNTSYPTVYTSYPTDAMCSSCIAKNKRSQWGEDRRLLAELAAATGGFMHAGTFVEIGALDGVWLSNTHLYEKCFGWHGLLIEASEINFRKLVKSGRSNSAFVHSAICAGQPKNVTMIHGARGQTSTELSQSEAASKGHSVRAHQVQCRSMTAILADHGLTHPTWLSLDVEGAEMNVLSAVDPTVFDVILVEWGPDGRRNSLVAELLSGAGMRFLRQWTVSKVATGGRSRVYGNPAFTRRWERFTRQTVGHVPSLPVYERNRRL